MGIKQLAMVTVQVRDFDGTLAWYRDVLGLTVAHVEPDEFAVLAAPDGGVLGLATDHPDRIPDRPGLGATPNFTVDDFDATIAAFREQGVVFDADEEGAAEGYRLVRIRDPEGNPIGLTA
jgi:catechol 2,3-dioxygenase-like lactoylglutathione lyase family enzyme